MFRLQSANLMFQLKQSFLIFVLVSLFGINQNIFADSCNDFYRFSPRFKSNYGFYLTNYRNESLETTKVTLDQYLDAVISIENNPAAIIELAKVVNSDWLENEIENGIKKRTSILGQAKGLFKYRWLSEEQNIIQAEFVIRYYPKQFKVIYGEKANEVFNKVFAKPETHYTKIIGDPVHAQDGIFFLEQFYKVYTGIFGLPEAKPVDLAKYAWGKWTTENRKTMLRSWVVHDPKTELSKSLLEIASADKQFGHGHVVALAIDGHMWKSNPAYFKTLVERSFDAKMKDAAARNLVHAAIKTMIQVDPKSGLDWSREVTHLSIANRHPIEASHFVSLLAVGSSSKAYRTMILDEIASLGKEALALYVGSDVGMNRRLQSLIELSPTKEDGKKELEAYLMTVYFDTQIGQVPALKKSIDKKYPGVIPGMIAKKLRQQKQDQDYLKDINEALGRQDQVNLELQRALESVITANAPPEKFAKTSSRPWTAYLESIPMLVRSQHTLELLKKNSGSVSQLAQFISNLDPIPGVVTPVVRFLASSSYMNSNRSDFSQDQVKAMFGGDRFLKFFPHVKNETLDGAIRTKFIMAVLTSPLASTGLSLGWLSQKLDDNDVKEGVPRIYGFRPVLQYARLRSQMQEQFSNTNLYGGSAERQLKGLVVQGYYEKKGHSLMDRLIGERGDDQVESTAPALVADIERSLRGGLLSKQPYFVKSHFAKFWVLNKNSSLIESIRNRAIRVTGSMRGFYELRVEIHNFPSTRTLGLVKEYRKTAVADADAIANLDALIVEIEQFLQIGNSTSGVREVITDKLAISDQSRTDLLAMTDDFDSIAHIGKAKRLVAIRNRLDEIKDTSASTEKEIERYRGQLALSDAGVSIFNKWLETFSETSSAERVMGVEVILNHMKKDGLVSAEEAENSRVALVKIEQMRRLDPLKRKELQNRILNSILDRIYFELFDNYGVADNSVYQTVKGQNPVKFVDDVLRSGFPLILSKIIEKQSEEIAIAKNLAHQINGKTVPAIVHVHNRGVAVGKLRVNKDAMSLTENDIGVFQELPAESAPVAGFISVGVGARLSHLQLLAKSLKIPNVQVGGSLLETLNAMDGQLVRLSASEEGLLKIEPVDAENRISVRKNKLIVPKPNHEISSPISFADYRDAATGSYAGPKGIVLAKLFQSGQFSGHVEDGMILPFGFFHKYAVKTGIQDLLEALGRVKLSNRFLIGSITAAIQNKINQNPIPEDMMAEVMVEAEALKKRTGKDVGLFHRSDTNAEDLPDFNGAGLNESVPNVALNKDRMNAAIRQVWLSPLSEKSIYWRGVAIGRPTVTIAEPSVVIMPTVNAKSSGVLISRGGTEWKPGLGSLNANFGIGSVVQAERPVEEYTFEFSYPMQLSTSTSRTMPVAEANGGLVNKEVLPGKLVLSETQAQEINQMGQRIESYLGNQPHGWDIEWAIDQNDKLIILQARPNM